LDRRQFLSTPALALSAATPADALFDLMEKRRDSPRVCRKGADRYVTIGELDSNIFSGNARRLFRL
jgi:hypothetical protein